MKYKLAMIVLSISVITPAFAEGTGGDTYKAKCAMCHGADGIGNTPAGKSMKVKSFLDPELLKASDADLVAATTNGKGKMPAYKGKLTEPEIKETVAHIRLLQKGK